MTVPPRSSVVKVLRRSLSLKKRPTACRWQGKRAHMPAVYLPFRQCVCQGGASQPGARPVGEPANRHAHASPLRAASPGAAGSRESAGPCQSASVIEGRRLACRALTLSATRSFSVLMKPMLLLPRAALPFAGARRWGLDGIDGGPESAPEAKGSAPRLAPRPLEL